MTLPSVSPAIEFAEVSLRYGEGMRTSVALDSVALSMKPRSFVGILGPSGSGKSSLLYLASGLKQPSAGEVRVAGRELAKLSAAEMVALRRSMFGIVFQQPYLLHYLSAAENIGVGLPQREMNAAEKVGELALRLGIDSLLHKLPHELSGGERQRVCIARAVIGSPPILLADEPTAALDHANGHEVMNLLVSCREFATVMVVTHDPEMLEGADMVVRMRDGRVEDVSVSQ